GVRGEIRRRARWGGEAARPAFRAAQTSPRQSGEEPGPELIQMALPAVLQKLRIPVICARMFIAGNPKLVIEQCKAGVVGSFPALNARPKEKLDEWLTEIE